MEQKLNIIDYKKISNLCDFFKIQLKNNPQKGFLYSKQNSDWREYTYLELNNIIKKIIFFLLKNEISKNDRVMLISNNRIEWFASDMAILSVGAITVPSFSTNNINDNKFILEDSKPSIIILENISIYKRNLAIFKKFKKKILFIEDTPGFLSIQKINISQESFKLPRLKKSDICSIIYTSGTSGNPKGVVLTHGSIIHNLEAAYYLLKELNINREKFLSFLPLSHSYERMAGLYFPLSINAKIYYCNSLDKINKDFVEVKPTLVTAVPRLYENIYKKINAKFKNSNIIFKFFFNQTINLGEKERRKKLNLIEFFFNIILKLLIRNKIKKIFGGKLKTFVSGGAALNPTIGNFFLNMGCCILQGYGQTEAAPLISCNNVKQNNTKTVGSPVKGVTIKISNADEILVKGKNVMLGYWNNKSLTKKTIKNGWLHTGDLGYFDLKNRLIINGRKKDLIVTSGGENISPQKIESLLIAQDEIIQAAVFGNYKPYIIALLVVKESFSYEYIKKIINNINKKLNSPEKIRKFIIINNEFTYEKGLLTQTLKIKRDVIFKYYKKKIEQLYFKS